MSKKILTKAFRELRKAGYFAKQNFWCCQSCAWADIPDDKAGKAVFYHAQDNSELRKTGSCHLAWSGDANEIIKILNDNGVKTSWDGSENKRIKININ